MGLRSVTGAVLAAVVLAAGAAAAQSAPHLDIVFNTGQRVLPPGAEALLPIVVERVKAQHPSRIVLDAYATDRDVADSIATPEAFALRRANAVADALKAAGLPAEVRITIRDHGPKDLLAPGDALDPINRIVRVTLEP